MASTPFEKYADDTLVQPQQPVHSEILIGSEDNLTPKNQQQVDAGRNPSTDVLMLHPRSGMWISWLPSRIRSAIQCGGEDGIGSGLKPTTRLVLIVVILSFVIALAVGGTAVGIGWATSMSAAEESLAKELDLVMNAADAFAVNLSQYLEVNFLGLAASLVSSMVNIVTYQTNIAAVSYGQREGARLTGLMLDHTNRLAAKHSVLSTLKGMSLMLDGVCNALGSATFTTSTLIDMVNTINRDQLTDDEELLLFSGDSSSQTVISIRSTTKFSSACNANRLSLASCDPLSSSQMITIMREALKTNQAADSFVLTDYALISEVYGAFTYLKCMKLGLVYNVKGSKVRNQFLNRTIDALNSANEEYAGFSHMMLHSTNRPGYSLTTLGRTDECPAKGCTIDMAAYRAIVNESTQIAIDQDYRQSDKVIAAVAPLTSMDGILVFETDLDDIISTMIPALTLASSAVNSQLPYTMELLLGQQVVLSNGTKTYQMLTTPRYAKDCPKNGTACQNDEGLYESTVNCRTGYGNVLDYRQKPVMAGYGCMNLLGVGLVVKLDVSDAKSKSESELIDYINTQNQKEKGSLEFLLGRLNATTGLVDTLTKPKAPYTKHLTHFEPMDDTVSTRSEGTTRSTDYRGEQVLVHSQYFNSLDIGFLIKIDMHELNKPLVVQLGIVLGVAIGIALLGVLLVGFAAKTMLFSIEQTWETSKRVVEEQKASFERLVSALYPKFASDRLLAGDSQIVLELPEVAVFFSDICSFSTISNRLTAQELMSWIGYTFGVMDHIADFYSIYKVKTIGDAYFALAGLPNTLDVHDASNPTDVQQHTLQMIRFAAVCVQVFSGRYIHPDSGACLQMIASHSRVMRKEKQDAVRKARKKSLSHQGSVHGSNRSSISEGRNKAQGQCAMRYGIAAGPVTVGVLPGKCPVFDVWGKTVNLACRMESGSRPGAILCSEQVFRNAVATPTNPFTFYEQISTFAKGFGNVPAFFVAECKELPPKTLLEELSLEPQMSHYRFEIEGMSMPSLGSVRYNNARGNNNKPLDVASAGPTPRSNVGSPSPRAALPMFEGHPLGDPMAYLVSEAPYNAQNGRGVIKTAREDMQATEIGMNIPPISSGEDGNGPVPVSVSGVVGMPSDVPDMTKRGEAWA